MGSYNSWCIDAQADSEQVLNIIDCGRSFDRSGGIYWDEFCWRKWCEQTKWHPVELVRKISQKFSNIIFSVGYSGDYGSGKIYILNGRDIESDEVFPRPLFPSMTLLKKAIKQKDARDAQLRLQQEKERAAKQAEATQKRIRDLENELKTLKSVPLDLGAQHG